MFIQLNIIKKISFVLFSVLLTAQLSAKTLVISDIDDTIKASHVRSKISAITNAFKTKISFKGHSELFHFLKKNIKDTSFYYVSNAPSCLMKRSHRKFIKRNHFPVGEVLLRKKYSSSEHKIKTIKEIIKKELPQSIILFGDNGEKDILFYKIINDFIIENYPLIKVTTFIHHLYEGDRILQEKDGQSPYVTPLEVLSKLYEQQEYSFSKEKLEKLSIQLSQKVLNSKRKRRSLVFPKWISCEKVNFINSLPHQNSQIIEKAFLHIKNICHDS